MTHFVFPLFKVSLLLCSCLLLTISSVHAQENLFGNWYAWFNNVKINEKWGLNNDIQFRAGKNWKENSMFLIRPGINYYVSETQTASLGYATTILTNNLSEGQPRLTEHRIWEQYIITGKIASVPVQHRFRLEQRFLKRSNEDVFSQRVRYFIRGIIPLNTALKNPFTTGPFMAIQNELFFNIQNKDKL
ncbi:MAG: DUF2490 domain-containing protein, partial [Sphingobacterium sp.]